MPTPEIVTPAERSDEWYDKAAKRRRKLAVKRLEKAMPLFAPLADAKVPVKTGAALREEEEASWERIIRMESENAARFLHDAASLRADVAARVPPETMATLDAWVAERSVTGLRARYLADPAYLADHWHTVKARLDAGCSPVEPRPCVKPRARVDPEAVFAVLDVATHPLRHADVAEALDATVLDVVDAMLALRDAGRVVNIETRNRSRGFVVAGRAA